MSYNNPQNKNNTPTDIGEAIKRLYANNDIIYSNDASSNATPQTAEEKADYLFQHGYIDEKTISRESAVNRIKAGMKEKEDNNAAKSDTQ